MRLCFIDVETTGLIAGKHGIWQLACVIMENGKPVSSIALEMCPPENKQVFTKGALEVANRTEEEILAMQPSHEAFSEFIKFLSVFVDKFDKKDKLPFIAYNSPFDNEFVRKWFLDHGDKYFGSWFKNETCVMRKFNDYLTLTGEEGAKNTRLLTVAEHLGVVPKVSGDGAEWHDARFDVKAAINIYTEINRRLRKWYQDTV